MRVLLLYYLFSSFIVSAQKVEVIANRDGVSFRGVSVVNDKIIWVSGSKGTVGRSIDGGKSWQWANVPDFEGRDFRDIEAFDSRTAIIMAVGEPAVLLKTDNSGVTWKTVYRNETPGMFLDALEFWNNESGIVVGDPVNGKFFIARTFDNGNNWKSLTPDKLPDADSGEACFAASGTNVRALQTDEACFVTGGTRTRLFWKNAPVDIPVIHGEESQGVNSVAVWYKKRNDPLIVAVGGDFAEVNSAKENCAISTDGGKTWKSPQTAPSGYRSCVEFLSSKKLISCGVNGVDISDDEGINWRKISDEGFHVCRKAKKGKDVYLAGNGKIGKLVQE